MERWRVGLNQGQVFSGDYDWGRGTKGQGEMRVHQIKGSKEVIARMDHGALL